MFISIEGIEGAGKSTLISGIEKFFQNKEAKKVLITREPGGSDVAEILRPLILDPKYTLSPETELLLFFAARCDHLKKVILPSLTQNNIVISDRYIDATYAYQGGGRNIPFALIDDLVSKFDVKMPDITLLIDMDPDTSKARITTRNQSLDRIEAEQEHFFAKVRQTYLQRAKEDPNRIKIINGKQSIDKVLSDSISLINAKYYKQNHSK